MKALILSDEINQFHWSMLKSVLLVLSILPASQEFCIYGRPLKAAARLWWVSLPLA